jgi:hypothetical protein
MSLHRREGKVSLTENEKDLLLIKFGAKLYREQGEQWYDFSDFDMEGFKKQ